MFKPIINFFKPVPFRERLSAEEIERLYPRYRRNILESTFLGYSMFYLARNNINPVVKTFEGAMQYTHSDVGTILAVSSIMYGIGKFLMGSLSDRSNPRVFMSFGLFLTAVINIAFGSVASFPLHLALWSLNGLVQGMGWPPCGRSIGHWFSVRERGAVFGIWNIAHNIGGGIAGILSAEAAVRWGLASAFYVPAVICLAGAVYLAWRLRDTPQSLGLPSIEEYKVDYPEKQDEDHEKELDTRTLFIHYILKNRMLWAIAFANFFVYIIRYCMNDWGPTYLQEVKQATIQEGGRAIAVLEWAGIPSTLLIGWLSDKTGGRRGMVSLLCMLPILGAFIGLQYNPPGNIFIDMVFLGVIGFFIYPPVMLLGVASLDLTSKKAVGTAAGFVGLFGYMGKTVESKMLGYLAQSDHTWNSAFIAIYASIALSIILLSFTWKMRPRG